VLNINFWVCFFVCRVGLKFTGRSAKLLITRIMLKFFRADPQGVLHVFPIRELSTKLAEHFVFLSTKHQPSVFIPPSLLELACFFGRSRCFRCCVDFFIIWWLLSSEERLWWALQLFPFQHTLAHVLIHQRKESVRVTTQELQFFSSYKKKIVLASKNFYE